MARRAGDKKFMSYNGKAIYYTATNEGILYMVAKGNGTDKYFLDWKDAMDWIDEIKEGKQ